MIWEADEDELSIPVSKRALEKAHLALVTPVDVGNGTPAGWEVVQTAERQDQMKSPKTRTHRYLLAIVTSSFRMDTINAPCERPAHSAH